MKTMQCSFHQLLRVGITLLALATAFLGRHDVNAANPASLQADSGKTVSLKEIPRAADSVDDTPDPTEAARFLLQSTFGPTESDINALVSSGYSDWIKRQLAAPLTSAVDDFRARAADYALRKARITNGDILDFSYRAQVSQPDQLRQRMVFALSQILVTSIEDPMVATESMANYIDILNSNAFGNYRDLLEQVTYAPAMAVYLTYLNNKKADPQSGSVPDENYAREIMQLFTIGLVELNPDGTPKSNAQGRPIETYTNADITGLAQVFTGLSWGDSSFGGQKPEKDPLLYAPLKVWPAEHTPSAKTFLGVTIPAGTDGAESIDAALDRLFAHPNIAPFLAKQLIQRFVTSNPSPQYVRRVAEAFLAGAYMLPDHSIVGARRKGDLAATLAAVLFDTEARDMSRRNDPAFGRLREPALRLAHWARVSGVNEPAILNRNGLFDRLNMYEAYSVERIGQQQYRSPSVFNFYRPGYIAPGSESGAANLVAPELQITTTSSVVGYANFMRRLIENTEGDSTFLPSYSTLLPLAKQPEALVDKLSLVMTANATDAKTRKKIAGLLKQIWIQAASREEDSRNRVNLAMTMIVLSPEYAVLR